MILLMMESGFLLEKKAEKISADSCCVHLAFLSSNASFFTLVTVGKWKKWDREKRPDS